MRLMVAGCVLILVLSAVVAEEAADDAADKDQDEEEYEEIAVAESQDIAHSRLHPNSDSDDIADRPRSRPRGRKRRRRLRKRPRSTTPSFIEDYNPERSVKEEDASPTEEEVVYRRRPSKRRRRPIRRKPEYDSEHADLSSPREKPFDEPSREPYDEGSEYRPRNPPRRRRKGGRKRIRVSTEPTESSDDSHDETLQEITTQPSEVVVQSNNFSPEKEISHESFSVESQENSTPSSMFTSPFTPREITEINHKLGPFTEYSQSKEFSSYGLEFSANSPSSIDLTSHNIEENHIVHHSTTTKDYDWINRFNPKGPTRTTTLETTTPTVTTLKFGLKEEKKAEIKGEPQQNIKNIEKIIENRKNLLSKTRRLPTTSAVIRRRLRPRKYKNTTTTHDSANDNNVPTIHPLDSNNPETPCKGADCELRLTSLLTNNIEPSKLLPSGFPTMPEVLSTAELIQRITRTSLGEKELLKETGEITDSESINNTSNDLIIITPSTLVRSPDFRDNGLSQSNENKKSANEIIQKSYTKADVQTDFSTLTEEITKTEEVTKTEELTTLLSTETTITTTTQATTISSGTQTPPTTEGKDLLESSVETTTESDLKLDGVDVSNINDEILELIMDEMGKARVKRILELRNMTLSELIAHRERGAGHFSAFINQNKINNSTDEKTNITTETSTNTETDFSTQDTNDEEKTETMIVEKAKHLMSEYKKSEEDFTNIMKSSHKEDEKHGKRLKVEGTVIPVPILEPTHTSNIQFPDDGILGAFPKYMNDIARKKNKPSEPVQKTLYTGFINTPRELPQSADKREPRVFESMPRFDSETSNKDNLEISPYPDWRITVSKHEENINSAPQQPSKSFGFPGISEEIPLVATPSQRPTDLDDVILLDEGEEIHHLRNHILGGKHNVESGDITDEDYPEPKKVPQGVKSAIAASGALLGLAIFGFLAVLVSCKIRQRRARLRARQDILCEHLAEDLRGSQRSLTPVLRKSPFNHTIHSNTASNRHYYLWRTLRKTFQYE